MILFNGLRPSFPHFATPANKNSEISEFFRDSRKLSDSGALKSTQSVSFQLLLWGFTTFSLKIRENITLPELQKRADRVDQLVLFFLAGAIFWEKHAKQAKNRRFFGANLLGGEIGRC